MKNYTRSILFLQFLFALLGTSVSFVGVSGANNGPPPPENEQEKREKEEYATLLKLQPGKDLTLFYYEKNPILVEIDEFKAILTGLYRDVIGFPQGGDKTKASLNSNQIINSIAGQYPLDTVRSLVDAYNKKIAKRKKEEEQKEEESEAARKLEQKQKEIDQELDRQQRNADIQKGIIEASKERDRENHEAEAARAEERKSEIDQKAKADILVNQKRLEAERRNAALNAKNQAKQDKERHEYGLITIEKQREADEGRFAQKVKDLTEPRTVGIALLFGSSLFIVYFLAKNGIPYLLSFLFVKPPVIVKESSLPMTWGEYLAQAIFGKKKRKSYYEIMVYNDDNRDFVDAQIAITKGIQKRNKNLKKGQRKFGHGHLLLHGPSGTGKTLLAKEIGRSCDMDFIFVNTALLSQFKKAGDAVAQVRKLFEYATQNKNRQIVLILDEFDAIFGQRGADSDDKDQKIINTFLGFIETKNNPSIKIIAITNYIELIDKAVANRLTPERIEAPTKDKRVKLLQNYMKEIEKQGVKVSLEVIESLDEIADSLDGETGRFIKGMWDSLRNDAEFVHKKRGVIEKHHITAYIKRHKKNKQAEKTKEKKS